MSLGDDLGLDEMPYGDEMIDAKEEMLDVLRKITPEELVAILKNHAEFLMEKAKGEPWQHSTPINETDTKLIKALLGKECQK